jgi:DUF2993 family protein
VSIVTTAPVGPPERARPHGRLRRLILLGVLASVVGLLGTDVIARQIVQRVAASRAQDAMSTPRRPSVHLDGTPFLTQLFRGRLERVRFDVRDASACGVRIGDAHATLRGVRQRSQGVAVDSVVGDGLLSYDELSRAVAPLRVSAGPPGQVRVSGGVGPFGFTASAAPRIEGDSLIVAPVSAAASPDGAPQFDLSGFPPIRIQLRKIPVGLALNIEPAPDGLSFSFSGKDVVLDGPGCAGS